MAVVPECVMHGAESAEHYDLMLQRVQALKTVSIETDREKRWQIAEVKLSRRTMCSPNSLLRKRWDIMQVFLLCYVALVVPYRIGFSDDAEISSFWFWFDVLVDLYFLCDIILSFRTGYVDSRGELQYKGTKIVSNYLRNWFTVDVTSCLPVNYLPLIFKNDSISNARSNKMIKL